MGKRTVTVLDDSHVRELLAILRAEQSPGRADMVAVLGQVAAMEKQLDAAVKELAAMRRELAEARELGHPVADALRKAVKSLETGVIALRGQLTAIGRDVIDGCKRAVAAFREKGAAALDNIARFFHIRPGLEALRSHLDKCIREDEQAMAAIEAASARYHEAGLHLKNVGRALLGKEVATEAKAVGKLAKGFEAPLRAECALFASMRKGADKAIGGLARLEDRAAARRPTIRQTIEKLNTEITQAQKAAPTQERNAPEHTGR